MGNRGRRKKGSNNSNSNDSGTQKTSASCDGDNSPLDLSVKRRKVAENTLPRRPEALPKADKHGQSSTAMDVSSTDQNPQQSTPPGGAAVDNELHKGYCTPQTHAISNAANSDGNICRNITEAFKTNADSQGSENKRIPVANVNPFMTSDCSSSNTASASASVPATVMVNRKAGVKRPLDDDPCKNRSVAQVAPQVLSSVKQCEPPTVLLGQPHPADGASPPKATGRGAKRRRINTADNSIALSNDVSPVGPKRRRKIAGNRDLLEKAGKIASLPDATRAAADQTQKHAENIGEVPDVSDSLRNIVNDAADEKTGETRKQRKTTPAKERKTPRTKFNMKQKMSKLALALKTEDTVPLSDAAGQSEAPQSSPKEEGSPVSEVEQVTSAKTMVTEALQPSCSENTVGGSNLQSNSEQSVQNASPEKESVLESETAETITPKKSILEDMLLSSTPLSKNTLTDAVTVAEQCADATLSKERLDAILNEMNREKEARREQRRQSKLAKLAKMAAMCEIKAASKSDEQSPQNMVQYSAPLSAPSPSTSKSNTPNKSVKITPPKKLNRSVNAAVDLSDVDISWLDKDRLDVIVDYLIAEGAFSECGHSDRIRARRRLFLHSCEVRKRQLMAAKEKALVIIRRKRAQKKRLSNRTPKATPALTPSVSRASSPSAPSSAPTTMTSHSLTKRSSSRRAAQSNRRYADEEQKPPRPVSRELFVAAPCSGRQRYPERKIEILETRTRAETAATRGVRRRNFFNKNAAYEDELCREELRRVELRMRRQVKDDADVTDSMCSDKDDYDSDKTEVDELTEEANVEKLHDVTSVEDDVRSITEDVTAKVDDELDKPPTEDDDQDTIEYAESPKNMEEVNEKPKVTKKKGPKKYKVTLTNNAVALEEVVASDSKIAVETDKVEDVNDDVKEATAVENEFQKESKASNVTDVNLKDDRDCETLGKNEMDKGDQQPVENVDEEAKALQHAAETSKRKRRKLYTDMDLSDIADMDAVISIRKSGTWLNLDNKKKVRLAVPEDPLSLKSLLSSALEQEWNPDAGLPEDLGQLREPVLDFSCSSVRSTPQGKLGSHPIVDDVKRLAINKDVGETQLHKAARTGYCELIQHCVERRGMDVNAVRDHAGYTALHEACVAGNLKVAQLLLLYGANVHAHSQDGTRPIHDAVDNNHVEMVRLLLSCGADLHRPSFSGRIPLKMAASKGDMLRNLLRGHLADRGGTAPLDHCEMEAKEDDDETEGVLQPQHLAWEFSAQTQLMDDVTEPGYDVFDAVDNVNNNMDSFAFHFCDTTFPQHYDLCLQEGSGMRRYHLLRDILHHLKVKSAAFAEIFPYIKVYQMEPDQLEKLNKSTSASKQSLTLAQSRGPNKNGVFKFVEIEPKLLCLLDITEDTVSNCGQVIKCVNTGVRSKKVEKLTVKKQQKDKNLDKLVMPPPPPISSPSQKLQPASPNPLISQTNTAALKTGNNCIGNNDSERDRVRDAEAPLLLSNKEAKNDVILMKVPPAEPLDFSLFSSEERIITKVENPNWVNCDVSNHSTENASDIFTVAKLMQTSDYETSNPQCNNSVRTSAASTVTSSSDNVLCHPEDAQEELELPNLAQSLTPCA